MGFHVHASGKKFWISRLGGLWLADTEPRLDGSNMMRQANTRREGLCWAAFTALTTRCTVSAPRGGLRQDHGSRASHVDRVVLVGYDLRSYRHV